MGLQLVIFLASPNMNIQNIHLKHRFRHIVYYIKMYEKEAHRQMEEGLFILPMIMY